MGGPVRDLIRSMGIELPKDRAAEQQEKQLEQDVETAYLQGIVNAIKITIS